MEAIIRCRASPGESCDGRDVMKQGFCPRTPVLHVVIPPKLNVHIYAVRQDTQSVSMSEFYSALMLARHVSDLIGPSSGAFFLLA